MHFEDVYEFFIFRTSRVFSKLTTFLNLKLMKHLQKERNLTVEISSPGIYYISKATFKIQIIVTRELPPDENLYLCCLTECLQDINHQPPLQVD